MRQRGETMKKKERKKKKVILLFGQQEILHKQDLLLTSIVPEIIKISGLGKKILLNTALETINPLHYMI